ncbi:hypothetical protein QR685DRAFT_511655 [Neurospora intermedia]|uniref:Uncharacterized protein n=1 Tax=Neurospora intermedia TaxID=5142 RepID=A0ABR3DRX0_NEUIN
MDSMQLKLWALFWAFGRCSQVPFSHYTTSQLEIPTLTAAPSMGGLVSGYTGTELKSPNLPSPASAVIDGNCP